MKKNSRFSNINKNIIKSNNEKINIPESELSETYKKRMLSLFEKILAVNEEISESSIDEIIDIIDEEDFFDYEDYLTSFKQKDQNFYYNNEDANILIEDEDLVFDSITHEYRSKIEKRIMKKLNIKIFEDS